MYSKGLQINLQDAVRDLNARLLVLEGKGDPIPAAEKPDVEASKTGLTPALPKTKAHHR